jgi:hypothetical protein
MSYAYMECTLYSKYSPVDEYRFEVDSVTCLLIEKPLLWSYIAISFARTRARVLYIVPSEFKFQMLRLVVIVA